MSDGDPVIQSGVPESGRLILRGDWTAGHAARMDAIVSTPPRGAKELIDIGGVGRLDVFGAWAIETLRRAVGPQAVIQGGDGPRLEILDQIRRADLTAPAGGRTSLLDRLERVGRSVVAGLAYLLRAVSLCGELAIYLAGCLRAPAALRPRSIVHHLDQAGFRAAPIIALMTFLIGLIVAQQGLFYFRRFGAQDYVVNLVTVLVLRELATLLVAIMLAGRSGSAFAAEIGSMKMREEIDALRTMGLSAPGILVLPRVVALIVAAPLLTAMAVIAGLYGAGLVMWVDGGMSPAVFIAKLHAAATRNDFVVGLVKAPIMALVIGLVAALEGFAVEGSAESLGLRTTSSVVKSIFLVIVLDGVFAVIFTSIGM